MSDLHDYHVELNQFNPGSSRPWLVENALGCVVDRYATSEEAEQRERQLNEQTLADEE